MPGLELEYIYIQVDEKQGCGSGSGPFWSDPDLGNFHRIRILSVLWQCKVLPHKQGKNILKIEVLLIIR